MFQQSTITSQDWLQPMDKWEDYPIKVLDIAPLIMVTLPTVSSFFSTCGWFLQDGRSSSGDLPPLSLSLACGWPPGANGSPFCEWRCLQDFRVENPSGARKGGPNRPPWVLMHLCTLPLHLNYFDDVILASKMKVLFAWSPVFYASIPGGVPT
jgi:hypothetical protein